MANTDERLISLTHLYELAVRKSAGVIELTVIELVDLEMCVVRTIEKAVEVAIH